MCVCVCVNWEDTQSIESVNGVINLAAEQFGSSIVRHYVTMLCVGK